MFNLSEGAKIGIVSGAIGILILMLICMICKLNKLKNSSNYRVNNRLHKKGALYENQMLPRKRKVSSVSVCSECTRERNHESNELHRRKESPYHEWPSRYSPYQIKGELKFLLTYHTDSHKLHVNLIEASHLVGKDFWDTVDSYVKARLHPDEKGDHKFQGKIYRKSSNPSYNESFQFAITRTDFIASTLKLSVWEVDKYSRHRLIGQTDMELKSLNKLDEPVVFVRELQPVLKVRPNLGNILFSLSYLPTAERLSIVIMKAQNLDPPFSEWKAEPRPINPFVKVVLLFDGKKVKKKRTSLRRQEANPVYNDAMTFDVPAVYLHRVLFVISVADKTNETTRSDVIGRVVIGSATSGDPLKHWHQMLIAPRKPVAAWHKLRL